MLEERGGCMAKMWEQREDETSQQYAAFQCYYLQDAAARSIKNAVAEYQRRSGKTDPKGHNSRFNYWSAQFEWVKRAEAWDSHLAKKREAAFLRGTEKGVEKQAVNLEKMRTELATKFDEIGEGADAILEKIFENPGEYNIKLSELNGLMRVRLDIYRALSKGDSSGGGDNEAARLEEAMKGW
jgi:hypothetical protein